MFTVPDTYLTAIQDPLLTREFAISATLQTPSGALTLSDDDFVAGSIEFSESSSSGNNLELGAIAASEFRCTLKNTRAEYDSMQFKRSVLTVQIGFKVNSTLVWISLGRFIITDASLPTTTIEIRAMDNMLRLERPLSSIVISYPVTAKNMLIRIATACGISVAAFSGLVNDSYSIASAPEDKMSCREAVGYLAAIMGCNVRMTRYGALELIWYGNHRTALEHHEARGMLTGGLISDLTDNTKIYDLGYRGQAAAIQTYEATQRKTFVLDSQQIVLSGLQYEGKNDKGDDIIYQVGSDRFCLKFEKNPFLVSGIETVLKNIWGKIGFFSYMPYTADVLANPALQAGDCVAFWNKEKTKLYRSIVTHQVYKYRSYQTLKAVGEAEELYQAQSPMAKAISTIVARQNKFVVEQSSMEKAITDFTNLMTGALGGYPITTEDAFYVADSSNLSAARRVWRWNLNGFGVSNSGVNGPYTSGIGADNSIVAWLATFGIVKADHIISGTLASQNGVSSLNLDTGEFNFGSGALVWDGNSLQAKGQVISNDGLRRAHIRNGQYMMFLNNKEMLNISCFQIPEQPHIVLGNGADMLNITRSKSAGTVHFNFMEFIDTARNTAKEARVKVNAPLELADSLYFGNSLTYLKFNNNVPIMYFNRIEGGAPLAEHYCYTSMRTGLLVTGNLQVTGTKNAVVQTQHYGVRAISAYETAESYLGDIGEGELTNGECIILIDPIFAEVVNTRCAYQVFLQAYGQGQIWISERQPDYFVVEGSNDMRFAWEIKAKRIRHESDRLEQITDDLTQDQEMNELNQFLNEMEESA